MSDRRIRALERRARQGDPAARAGLDAARARLLQQPGVYPGAIDGLVLVLGGRGSGKTTFLRGLERRALRRGCHSVIWDRLGQWSPRPGRTVVREASPEAVARVAIARAPCTLFLDEVHLAFPSSNPPREGTALCEIVRVGRQACAVGEFARPGPVALVAAAQRPANVHPDLKALLDKLFLGHFPATATRDLRWIEDVAGEDLARQLPGLRTGQFKFVDCR